MKHRKKHNLVVKYLDIISSQEDMINEKDGLIVELQRSIRILISELDRQKHINTDLRNKCLKYKDLLVANAKIQKILDIKI